MHSEEENSQPHTPVVDLEQNGLIDVADAELVDVQGELAPRGVLIVHNGLGLVHRGPLAASATSDVLLVALLVLLCGC